MSLGYQQDVGTRWRHNLAISTSTNNSQRLLLTLCAIVRGMHCLLFQQAGEQPIPCIAWVTGRCLNTVAAFPYTAQELPMSFAASMAPFRQCEFSLGSGKAGNQGKEVSSFLPFPEEFLEAPFQLEGSQERKGWWASCRSGCSPQPGIC